MKLNDTIINEIDDLLKEIEDKYGAKYQDDMMEYLWLKPSVTHLNVDIFVDDGFAFKRSDRSILLYVRNGYTTQVSDFIPMSVCEQPTVTDSNMDFNVDYEDLFAVQDFIQMNLVALIRLANEQISAQEFVQNLNIDYPKTFVAENKKILLEMATLRKKESGLPMDIWLDEGSTFLGHAPRIKFRASNEQRTTREFSSMLITDPQNIENIPSNSILRAKDIEKLRQFVKANQKNLLLLANKKISYLDDFLNNMVKIEE